jgi:glycosyltransferase involved in cell wall biosynthesis
VVVDTQANRDMFIKEFGLAPDKVYSIPLAIDEDRLIRAESVSRPSRERLRIFFVGTLIPLHGIEVILDAFALLAGDARFEFCLVGDGQQSDLVEAFITQHPHVNLRWIRDWCPLDRIASEIASSDICLGVFGGAGKAARVLPFKVYMYLAAGKAVITQPMYSLPAGCPPLPVMTAPDSLGIATAVEALLTPEKRRSLGIQGARYYSEFLSNAAVARAWEDLLRA